MTEHPNDGRGRPRGRKADLTLPCGCVQDGGRWLIQCTTHHRRPDERQQERASETASSFAARWPVLTTEQRVVALREASIRIREGERLVAQGNELLARAVRATEAVLRDEQATARANALLVHDGVTGEAYIGTRADLDTENARYRDPGQPEQRAAYEASLRAAEPTPASADTDQSPAEAERGAQARERPPS